MSEEAENQTEVQQSGGGLRSCRDAHLCFHDPPQVEDDASDDVDLGHCVCAVLVPFCSKAVVSGVT